MATDQSLEWQQARQWLINSGVIPATNKVTKPGVDLVDFVRSLRDGVFLCSLLNKLRPDVVPENEFNPKPLMQVTEHTCIQCETNVWGGCGGGQAYRLMSTMFWLFIIQCCTEIIGVMFFFFVHYGMCFSKCLVILVCRCSLLLQPDTYNDALPVHIHPIPAFLPEKHLNFSSHL